MKKWRRRLNDKGVYFVRHEVSAKYCNSLSWFIEHKYMVVITICQTPRNSIFATKEIQYKHINVRWTPLSVASLRETNEFTNIDGMK